jgi:hypothetical protein
MFAGMETNVISAFGMAVFEDEFSLSFHRFFSFHNALSRFQISFYLYTSPRQE